MLTTLYLIAVFSLILSCFCFLMANAAKRKKREDYSRYKQEVDDFLREKLG